MISSSAMFKTESGDGEVQDIRNTENKSLSKHLRDAQTTVERHLVVEFNKKCSVTRPAS